MEEVKWTGNNGRQAICSMHASECHVNSPGLYCQPEDIDTIRFPLSWVLCVCFN